MSKRARNFSGKRYWHTVVIVLVALTSFTRCKTANQSTVANQNPLTNLRRMPVPERNEFSSWSPVVPGDPLAKIPVGEANQCQGVVVGTGESSQLYWVMPAHCLIPQMNHPIEQRVRHDFVLDVPLTVHFSCPQSCSVGPSVALNKVSYWALQETNLAILPWPASRMEMEKGGVIPVTLGRYQADVDEALDAMQWNLKSGENSTPEMQRSTCLPGEFAAVQNVIYDQETRLKIDFSHLWRLRCEVDGIKDGTPLLSPVDGQLIALILATRARGDQGTDCQVQGPCERLFFGMVPLAGAVYGLPLDRLAACWSEGGVFQASRRGCHLPL